MGQTYIYIYIYIHIDIMFIHIEDHICPYVYPQGPTALAARLRKQPSCCGVSQGATRKFGPSGLCRWGSDFAKTNDQTSVSK